MVDAGGRSGKVELARPIVLIGAVAQGKIGLPRKRIRFRVDRKTEHFNLCLSFSWCAMSARIALSGFLFVAVANIVSMTAVMAQSQLPTVDEALEMSKRSGAPILAMAGQDY